MFNRFVALIRQRVAHLWRPPVLSCLAARLRLLPRSSRASPVRVAASGAAWPTDSTDGLTVEGPTVEILPTAFAKLRAYVEAVSGEVSGFGSVRAVDGNLVVSDVFIAPQHSSSTSTEISEDDLARFLNEFLDAGRDPGQLNLYWHSHAQMEVFWSRTDLHTMESAFPQADWVLGLVSNHRGDMKACLYLYRPVSVRLYSLPVRLFLDPELRAQIRDEVKRKVRQGYSGARWDQPKGTHHDSYGDDELGRRGEWPAGSGPGDEPASISRPARWDGGR